jgi:hypothetical protein
MLNLIIHEIGHSAAYFLLVIPLLHLLKYERIPWKFIILGYFISILIDLDHLVDYFIYKGSLSFNLWEFFTYNYFDANGKVYNLLHAWEWGVILLVIYLATGKRYKFILFIFVALSAQLLFDTISYGFDPKVYLITYRYMNNFTNAIFIPLR